MTSYLFDNYYDLSRLPYFELKDERIVIAKDANVGPIIDIHTHLALAYIRPWHVDLYKDHRRVFQKR